MTVARQGPRAESSRRYSLRGAPGMPPHSPQTNRIVFRAARFGLLPPRGGGATPDASRDTAARDRTLMRFRMPASFAERAIRTYDEERACLVQRARGGGAIAAGDRWIWGGGPPDAWGAS